MCSCHGSRSLLCCAVLTAPPYSRCSGGASLCAATHSPNPGFGTINFDTFLWAMVNVYVVTSQANWSNLMVPLWSGSSSLVTLYFTSLLLVGAFFAVNLVLVRRG